MKSSSAWLKSVRYRTKGISNSEVTYAQERCPGFSQSVLNRLRILLIGAGGIGSETALGLTRKGIFQLRIFDGDVVSLTNLTRQFFYKSDLGKNKAICLGKNLLNEATRETEIISHPFMFQKGLEEKITMECDLALCLPDNNETRLAASRFFLNKVPVVFSGLDEEASTGYVFVQEPGKACIACARPEVTKDKERNPCRQAASIIDLGKLISGLVLFAVDSTVMNRKRDWNYRQIFLNGLPPEILKTVGKREDCPVCRTRKNEARKKQILAGDM